MSAYICDAKYGPDSGGARWICRGEHVAGHLLVKADGLYLQDSSKSDLKHVQVMDDAAEEKDETREVTYCPKCYL